jgi:hypothetical protein
MSDEAASSLSPSPQVGDSFGQAFRSVTVERSGKYYTNFNNIHDVDSN